LRREEARFLDRRGGVLMSVDEEDVLYDRAAKDLGDRKEKGWLSL
jgi:hypothetical protein